VGPKALTGSREAKRQAAVLLEVLGGERGPQEGSQALGVSLTRYYLLETRALQGLILALEPRPRGKQKSPENRVAELIRDNARLQREVGRCQALVRAAQRSLGLPPSPRPQEKRRLGGKHNKKAGGRKVKRRRMVRGAKVVATLRQAEPEAASIPTGAGQEASPWEPDAPLKG
jgi:hypothetical protein